MIIRPDVELANMSDVGCVRSVNEDYFLYMEPQDQEEFVRRGRLMMVADGMGGHKGGQVASGLAIDIVRESFLEATSDDPRSVLIDSFQQAHRAILEASRNSEDLQGMGTTCCAAILKDGQLTFGHIGDSRLYLIRDGYAHALTDDHTMVNALLKRGILTPEEARTHDQRNVLTAALGAESTTIAGDFAESPLPMQAGDTLLMCSDGLHGLVSDEEMQTLATEYSLTDACRQLIALAKERGGPDNITVQLLRVRDVPA
jgi:serine/threonine protein phosphatase PrpC